jgi:hypothetical protein
MKVHPVLELMLAARHHLIVPRSLQIQKRFGGLFKVIPGDLVQVSTKGQSKATPENKNVGKLFWRFFSCN